MYSMQIFQYPGLVVKGLIKIKKVRIVKLDEILILYKHRMEFSIPKNMQKYISLAIHSNISPNKKISLTRDR